MPRRVIQLGLQCLAIVLAVYPWLLGGVRTDEAKYLLNIPYPQPPLGRWIIGMTEFLPFQELLWRLIIASLLVHAVFLIWKISAKCSTNARLFLCAAWLLSAGVLLQIGTIMMAPVTALQGLLLVALAMFPPSSASGGLRWAGLPLKKDRWTSFFIGLLWFASLFTAYQAVLYLPLAIEALWRTKTSLRTQILYIVAPVILVFVYALSNPLIIASFVNAGTENETIPFYAWIFYLARLWLSGGSVILTALGIFGMLRHRRFGLLGSFVLLSVFCFISFREYYDILFTSLFIGGAVLFLQQRKNRSLPFLPLMAGLVFCTAFFAWKYPVIYSPGHARAVMQEIQAAGGTGTILISGPFGHQWQYESRVPVDRYRSSAINTAQAVICLNTCEGIEKSGLKKADLFGVEVWMKEFFE